MAVRFKEKFTCSIFSLTESATTCYEPVGRCSPTFTRFSLQIIRTCDNVTYLFPWGRRNNQAMFIRNAVKLSHLKIKQAFTENVTCGSMVKTWILNSSLKQSECSWYRIFSTTFLRRTYHVTLAQEQHFGFQKWNVRETVRKLCLISAKECFDTLHKQGLSSTNNTTSIWSLDWK